MKTKLPLLAVALLLGGCISNRLPKDANLLGFENTISTPWGSSKTIIQEVNTGAAARNVTKAP